MDNTIYKKIAKRCRLERHIVRIENEFGCGTGFLYTVYNHVSSERNHKEMDKLEKVRLIG